MEAGDEIQATPDVELSMEDDSLTINDDLVVTASSTIKLLRDACRWLGISHAGSKQRMFDRCKKAKELALRRSLVESAREQYKSQSLDAIPVSVPQQPSDEERALHEITHVPFRPWCKYCVMSRSKANQHSHMPDPVGESQREFPTIQCDFFFMEPGKEGAVVALLMVDVWSRFVSVVPLKQRNAQTVGRALVNFISSVRDGTVEIAFDNEPVLVAGVSFCKSVRAKAELKTHVSPNKSYDKSRTGVAERFVQTIRGIQKTLICHLEDRLQATVPTGHPVIQWAALHSAWIYNRFHVHATLKTTPYQSLWGRPYKGRITGFGQTVFGLDPKAVKYKPGWRRGAWLGKDSADMDLISTDGQTIMRTKAVRKINNEWSSELVLGITDGPMDFFGHRQVKSKQRITALPGPIPQEIDEEAEAVRAFVSEGYSPSHGDDVDAERLQVDVQEWEDAGLEHASSPTEMSDQGGAVSPSLMQAPITPVLAYESDEDAEISAVSHKHPASGPLTSEHAKAQRMDDDPVIEHKDKMARTSGSVNQIAEVEICHNDEDDVFNNEWEDQVQFPDSEDEYIARHGEGEGPPEVSDEKLKELDARAAIEEIEKLNNMQVIQPVVLTPDEVASKNVVDTTLVYDWRFRGGQWIRRCRVVAREFKTGATDESNFSPTSSFASVRMLLVFALIFGLAVTALDIKDAFLTVPQVEVLYVEIPQWVKERTGKADTHWFLKRCLPGQRNAALRWHQHFGEICEGAGLVAFPGAPTIMRHADVNKKIFLNVHVDDILLVCNPEDLQWFQETIGATLTMKVDGPHRQGSGEQLMYLKKRITMREDGILIQPNATYVPKLVSLLKVSGRRRKGLPYHATLEAFSPEVALEAELLDGEQAATFRSGLGLVLHMAMDRPDIQFAVKLLSSYMSRPTIKSLAALKHLASYLDGTPDDGILLPMTEEGKVLSDFWKENELISDEAMIPDWSGNGRFMLEAYSDSSWADCKTSRKSTSSGVIFLNGALVLSLCRTQCSVALSSCKAELYAANGLVVESIYLFRLCKFLCGDESEVGSEMVQQRLFTDSSSALALVRRTGTGRLKHIQIKQFFLQHLLRTGVFSIFKINTKLNPGDLNTKRLSGERRRFLGRLINLYVFGDGERNDDNALRKIRKVNRMTKEQVIRLVQLTGAAIGMCMQLKGCSRDPDLLASGTNVNVQLVWWSMAEWTSSTMWSTAAACSKLISWVLFCMVQVTGTATLVVALVYLCGGLLIWQHYGFLRSFALRNASWMIGFRWTWLIKPVVWSAWWLLRQEILYLHARYQEAGQSGDMMVDIETLYDGIDEYLTGGANAVGAAALLESPQPPVEMEAEPVVNQVNEPFEGQDIAKVALQHVRLNGVHANRTIGETENDEQYNQIASPTGSDEMEVDETASQRRQRYQNSGQDEVSDPDEWAELHFGGMDSDNHQRMVAFSEANQLRLRRAMQSLEQRRERAEAQGNWAEAAEYTRAMAEVQNLMDIA